MAKTKSRKPIARQRGRRAGVRKLPATRRAAAETLQFETAFAALAHDIRTPLTGILALSELLLTSELEERERRWVVALKSAAEHLTALTTLVVDGARATAKGLVLRNEEFGLRSMAEALGASLEARAQAKGLVTTTIVAEDVPRRARGDAARLRAAVENLLDNAVKFTERGKVSLAVSIEPQDESRIRAVFSVTDSGIGMTPVEIKRLFRPFMQANATIARRYGGAGLGLVLIKRLAQAMNGRLTVDSKPGQGSTFRLVVALEIVPESSSRDEGDAAPAAGSERFRILCAEDNPYGRVIMNTILSELGHAVDFVGSGEAVIEAVQRGGYDVVLMDIVLGGMDGLEAARRIRALPGAVARIPILAISGHDSHTDEAQARGAGMDGYLRKPVGPRALAQALAACAHATPGTS